MPFIIDLSAHDVGVLRHTHIEALQRLKFLESHQRPHFAVQVSLKKKAIDDEYHFLKKWLVRQSKWSYGTRRISDSS